jgi:two-component system sensor histidine kinase CiaH
MFASVGRRLALLNAAVVALAIAVVGAATFALLRQSLNREADRALADRAEAAETAWVPLFVSSRSRQASTAAQTPDAEQDSDHDEGDDALEGGDTLLWAFDADGRILADSRGVAVAGLPVQEAVRTALQGRKETRDLQVGEENVRVYTAPVVIDGNIVGAIQAARSQGEHEAELRLVKVGSLIGIGVGILIAVPAGIFLSGRAMRPIGAAFARQRTFVADASHELRTPLAVIRANAELVQRLPSATEEVREEVGNIIDEVDEMARLADDLLLLARLDDAALQLDRKPHDLGETARAAAATMEDRARASGLSLTIQAATPVAAVFDAARIRQVLRILLDNAIAYTPAGGSIEVTIDRHSNKAVARVTDTGVGIAAEDQARVFDRFHRADHARTRKTGGAGLGLAIARALIEAHDGQIGLESAPGRGTTVWFTLPTPPAHGHHT